ALGDLVAPGSGAPAGQPGPAVQDRRVFAGESIGAGGRADRGRRFLRRNGRPAAVVPQGQARPDRSVAAGVSRFRRGRRVAAVKEAIPLDTLISVNTRFTRSVSLVRDAGLPDALRGYILTPTGRDVLHRLADALRGESATRAWSLTGPYGSGKSAFALFAAQ